MAGSPIKRARKKARRLAEEEGATVGANGSTAAATPLPAHNLPLVGEILPPVDAEPTRTAIKRAMRRKAEEHAERAMEVLAAAMECSDPKIAVPAAREILDRAVGKPTQEIEAGNNGVSVAIIRFGDQES